jgi:hypothetical protein
MESLQIAPQSILWTNDQLVRRQDQTIRDEEMLRAEPKALEIELDLVDQELVGLGAGLPTLLVGVGILTYFGLGGVAFPLALLARHNVPNGPLIRWIVWAVFLSGLALLIGFLLSSVASLKKGSRTKPKPPKAGGA